MIMQHWLFQWRCSISGEENIFISWNMCWKLYFLEISIENYIHKASIKKKGKKKNTGKSGFKNFLRRNELWVVFYSVYEVQNLENKLIYCFYVWGVKFEYRVTMKEEFICPRNSQNWINGPSRVLSYSSLWLFMPIITISFIFFLISSLLIAGSWAQRSQCSILCAYDIAWQIIGVNENIYQVNEWWE